MDYVIIVNDNGELKTVSATEIKRVHGLLDVNIEQTINHILDQRSQRELEETGGDE